MAWVQAAVFPLESDLSQLNQLLSREGVPHRFVEEAGKQILWVDSHISAEKVQFVLQQLEEGTLDVNSVNDNPGGRSLWRGVSIVYCPVTLATMLMCCIGYIVGTWFYTSQFHSLLTFLPLDSSPLITLFSVLREGEVWRLISPAFLHFGWPHLLMNTAFFYMVGQRLERYLGVKFYIVLLIILAFASNLSEYHWSETAYFGGLSGVLFGCFGFAGSLYIKVPNPILEMPRGIYASILFGLLIGMSGLLDILFGIQIGNASHLGGFITGLVLGTFFGDYQIKAKEQTRESE